MSKLMKKLQRLTSSSKKDNESHLVVDAVPTETTLKPQMVKSSTNGSQQQQQLVPTNDRLQDGGASPVQAEERLQDVTTTSNHLNQAQNILQFNNSSSIHIGNVLNYTLNQEQTTIGNDINDKSKPNDGSTEEGAGSLKKAYRRTRTIDALLRSTREVEHYELDIIATHLGEDWRSVARDLGFSNGEIDHFYEDNHAFGVKEVRMVA